MVNPSCEWVAVMTLSRENHSNTSGRTPCTPECGTFYFCDRVGETTIRLAPAFVTAQGTTLTMEADMDDDKLTPFQENELKWLRRQVDRAQDDAHRTDAHPNAKQDLWVAREHLDVFVRGLRKAGKKI